MNPKKQGFNGHFKLDFPSVNSFEEAEELYNKTPPLIGKRAALDIRPVGSSRRQTRFQIRKVSDDEYSLVPTYYNSRLAVKIGMPIMEVPDPAVALDAQRYLTFTRDGSMRIFCPTGMRRIVKNQWAAPPIMAIRQQPTNQTWNFLSQVLPDNMHVEKVGRFKGSHSKTYLVIDRPSRSEYYLLPKAVYELELKKDKAGRWRVLNPVQEVAPRLKKETIALVREAYKKFWPYSEVYWDLINVEGAPLRIWGSLGIIQMMIDNPLEALQLLKRSTGRMSAEAAIRHWKKDVRAYYYRDLDTEQLDMRKVPIGEKCGMPRYHPTEPIPF
jgi:hypothetical protein